MPVWGNARIIITKVLLITLVTSLFLNVYFILYQKSQHLHDPFAKLFERKSAHNIQTDSRSELIFKRFVPAQQVSSTGSKNSNLNGKVEDKFLVNQHKEISKINEPELSDLRMKNLPRNADTKQSEGSYTQSTILAGDEHRNDEVNMHHRDTGVKHRLNDPSMNIPVDRGDKRSNILRIKPDSDSHHAEKNWDQNTNRREGVDEDNDASSNGYEDSYSDPSAIQPFRNLLNQRTPRVLVCVITGGKKESVKTNRQAVLDTWFEKDTYFVTLEDVSTQNVIRLSPQAESGGHRGLPVKVKHMFQYIYENFLNDYDWFVKADDDTYINVERLKKTLSVFNPDIPVYLGKPFATKLKGVDGPSPLWRDFTTLPFCHGGAGYALSRELLRRTGPFFLKSPSVSALEDASTSAVLYAHTGVRCININSNMFGGFDLVGNSHDQKAIINTLQRIERSNPMVLMKTTTIHSVKAEATYYIDAMFRRLLKKYTSLENELDERAERDLEQRRLFLTSSWDCTLTQSGTELKPGKSTIPSSFSSTSASRIFQAMCQQSALLSSPPNRPTHIEVFDKTLIETGPYHACQVDTHDSMQSQQIFGFVRRSDQHERPGREKAWHHAKDGKRAEANENVVLVAIDSNNDQTLSALRLFVQSLRQVGCKCDIIIFTLQQSWVTIDECGVHVVEYNAAQVNKVFNEALFMTPLEDQFYFSLFETYLKRYEPRYKKALHARVDTFFQQDPFRTIPIQNGLTLFVRNPIASAEQVKCFRGYLRINERATKISVSAAIGTTSALRNYFARSIWRHPRASQCSFEDLVMLSTFRKEYAQDNPVVILNPWDGPISNLENGMDYDVVQDDASHNAGRLIFQNAKGFAVSIVTGYSKMLEFDTEGVLVMPNRGLAQIRFDLNRLALPERLYVVFDRISNIKEPTKEEWPLDSKAYLHWSELMSDISSKIQIESFQPLLELLSQHTRYQSNPMLPVIDKLAAPATHRTGAAILSSIFFRHAARNHLRIRHVGAWPFVPNEEVEQRNPKDRAAFDVFLSQFSAKGQWRGNPGLLFSYMDHLLGSKYVFTMMFSEPSQHYIDWINFFIAPKAQKKKPKQLLNEFLQAKFNRNLQTQELGIRSESEWDSFVHEQLPKFNFILVRERLDECLVLLRRMLNWDMWEMLYLKPSEMGRRFDGKRLTRATPVSLLDRSTKDAIRRLLPLDYKLYEFANEQLDTLISQQPSDFKDEVALFQKLQAMLANICKQQSSHHFCRWFMLDEYEILNFLGPQGYTKAVPLV